MSFFRIQRMGWGYSPTRKLLACTLLLAGVLLADQPYGQTDADRWYKGDLHAHSTYSDGDSAVADVIASAEALGLDFFALTDHDRLMDGEPVHWFDLDYHSDTMVLLYGVEWTSRLGHANVWSSAPFDYQELWQANRENDVEGALTAAHNQETLFSINHPSAFVCCPWRHDVSSDVDSMEVWNAMYSLPNFNRWSGHHVWDDLLKNGRRIPGVGGSDTHQVTGWQSKLFGHGNPTTWVYAEELTADAILAGIESGHVSISYSPHAVRLDFMADADGDGECETMMGDNIVHKSGQEISFEVHLVSGADDQGTEQGEVFEVRESVVRDLGKGASSTKDILTSSIRGNGGVCGDTYVLGVFKNGRLFRVWVLACGADSFAFKDVPEAFTRTYYRVELIGNPTVPHSTRLLYGRVIAMTNPIYVEFPPRQ